MYNIFLVKKKKKLIGKKVILRKPKKENWREWAELRQKSKDFLQPWEPKWPSNFLTRESFNIFINTTNIDNQPLSLIESMALGLAIVSTNAGGLPHLLTHDKTGKLVNCSDVSGMVKEIVDYLTNEDKRLNITQNARIQVEKNYSEINVIIKWYSLIDSILTIKRTSF